MRRIMTIIALLAPLVFFTSGAESKDSGDDKCPDTTSVLSEYITQETAERFERTVTACLQEKDGPTIKLYLNNTPGGRITQKKPGGDGYFYPTDSMVERVRTAPGRQRFEATATGKLVQSAALKILLVAAWREIDCGTKLKIHRIDYVDDAIYENKTAEEKRKLEEYIESLRDQYAGLIAYYTDMSLEEATKATRENKVLDWKEALEKGFVDATIVKCDDVKGAHEFRSAGTTFKRTARRD